MIFQKLFEFLFPQNAIEQRKKKTGRRTSQIADSSFLLSFRDVSQVFVKGLILESLFMGLRKQSGKEVLIINKRKIQ